MNIRERNGERGGEYLIDDLSGRILSVSRKPGDNRVWLGDDGNAASFRGQRGGIGNIDKLLDEWRSRIALDREARELYDVLSRLRSAKAVR